VSIFKNTRLKQFVRPKAKRFHREGGLQDEYQSSGELHRVSRHVESDVRVMSDLNSSILLIECLYIYKH